MLSSFLISVASFVCVHVGLVDMAYSFKQLRFLFGVLSLCDLHCLYDSSVCRTCQAKHIFARAQIRLFLRPSLSVAMLIFHVRVNSESCTCTSAILCFIFFVRPHVCSLGDKTNQSRCWHGCQSVHFFSRG